MNIEYSILNALSLVEIYKQYSIPWLDITDDPLLNIKSFPKDIKFLAIEQLDKVQMIYQDRLDKTQEQLITNIRKELCEHIDYCDPRAIKFAMLSLDNDSELYNILEQYNTL
jgi:hypothetical protein